MRFVAAKHLAIVLLLFVMTFSGCYSAQSVGMGPGEIKPLKARKTWMLLPPSTYLKLFPEMPSRPEGNIAIKVIYRDKLEQHILTSGKLLDNILTKISSQEKVAVTSFTWLALVKKSTELGPVAIIVPVEQYLKSPLTLDSIPVLAGDSVVILHKSDFRETSENLTRMFDSINAAVKAPAKNE